MSNTILVFDTETNGMVNFKKHYTDPCQPYLVQFAAILVSDDRIVKAASMIIDPDGKFSISKELSDIHGITNEIAIKYGVDRTIPIQWLDESIKRANIIVAHNFNFDHLIMKTHYTRNGSLLDINVPIYDTMKKSTNLVKLPGRRGSYKWPKLIELHQFLFGESFDGAHDALEDVRATYRCYCELLKRGIK